MTQGAMWVDLSCAQEDRTTEGERAGLARSRRRPLGGRRGVWLAGAIGACAVGWLTGCGSSPPAPQQTFADYTSTVTPTTTPTPDPSPGPVIAAPVRPPEMEYADEAGAIAAARYFLTLGSYAMRTGDLEEWRTVSGQTCEFCDNIGALVEEAYGAGHRLTGLTVEVDEARVLGVNEELAVYGVEVHYKVAPGREIDANGVEVRSFELEDAYIIIDVVPSDRGWVLVGGDARDGRQP